MPRLTKAARLEREARRGFRRRVLLGVFAFLAAVTIGGVIGYEDRSGSLLTPVIQPTPAMHIVGAALTLIGAALALGVVVYLFRTGRARRDRRSALWALSRSQRRSLRSQVLRNVVEPGTDPAAVRLMAQGMADQIGVLWALAGVAMTAAGEMVGLPTTTNLVYAAAMAVCFPAAVVVTVRQSVRADRFLREQALTEDSPTEVGPPGR